MPNDDNSSDYTPIQCQLYDYVEIACMRHYRLDIELVSGEIITGKAITTRIKDRQEFIVIAKNADTEENDKEREVRLDLIKNLTALDDNAEFGTVAIN